MERKTLRLGMDINLELTERTVQTRCNKVLAKLAECNVPAEKIDALKNNDPLPYPEIVNMGEDKKQEHAMYGRKFEVSMLQFNTGICACCGITAPKHQDHHFMGKNAPNKPLSRLHLKDTMKDAWECNCLGFCKGQHFYGCARTSKIAVFRRRHRDGHGIQLEPVEGENFQKRVKLCSICYHVNKTVARDPDHMERCLDIGWRGKNPLTAGSCYIATRGNSWKIRICEELRHELHTCTAVEEAAVRQIAILQNIVALK